jgi:glycosyltransferase involved in cell wall biosynthesis
VTATTAATESPRPQRIAIVIPSSGLFDSRTMRMARSLAGRGHEVVVHARAGTGAPAGETGTDGYRILRVATSRGRRLPLPIRVIDRAVATGRQGRAASKVDTGADIYQGTAFMGIPVAHRLAQASRAPVVYDALDLYADARSLSRLPGVARSLIRARERSWARRADAVVTVNDALAGVLEARFGIPRPAVVMNCAPRWDPPSPRPRRFHEALGLPADARIALYHGGLEPERGIEELLAVAPGLPPGAHVVLMGYGRLRDTLAARLRDDDALRGRVHLVDAVPPSDLLTWVASADVAVAAIQATTLNHRLATPNKLFEALAAGVPVVASDFPAMRRIVMDDPAGPLGAVCDPADIGALTRAIGEILGRGDDERAALGARCHRAASERYSWEQQLEVLLAVYGRLTGKPW